MEQQEIIHQYSMVGTSTLDKVLQVLNHLSMEGLEKLYDSQLPMKGETNLYKMMNRSDPLTSAHLNEKVDLMKLKAALTNQGLPFSFKTTSSGSTLFFRVKDKELAKNALENVLRGIKKSPGKILRTPGKMTFEEKVAYARSQYTYKGSLSQQTLRQATAKGRGK